MAASKKEVKVKLPKTVGETIDAIQKIKDEKALLSKKIVELGAQEDALEAHGIILLRQQKQEGGKGRLAQASIQNVFLPQVDDWDALYTFIVKRRAWDLLHKRVSSSAWRERLAAKVKVPGISSFEMTTLHLTRVKK